MQKRKYFSDRPLVNQQIRARRVRVVDETGKQLGFMYLVEALRTAREHNLDLIQVTKKIEPPVCKITDLGKYKYQQAKKEQKQKAKQKKIEVKGVRIGLSTSSHDLEHKAKQAEEFLGEGNKVRIEIKLKGREKAHQDLAREKLNNFLKLILVEHKIEEEPKRNPIGLTMTISKA